MERSMSINTVLKDDGDERMCVPAVHNGMKSQIPGEKING